MSSTKKFPKVPQTRDDLFIAAMRHANEVSGLLNDLTHEFWRVTGDDCDNPKWDKLNEMLCSRFGKHSAVHLFIAASNLRIELPDDLSGDAESEFEDTP